MSVGVYVSTPPPKGGGLFVSYTKERRSEDYFLTDGTDNTDDKNVDATNARMKVENLFLIWLTKTLINLCILPSHNYSSP